MASLARICCLVSRQLSLQRHPTSRPPCPLASPPPRLPAAAPHPPAAAHLPLPTDLCCLMHALALSIPACETPDACLLQTSPAVPAALPATCLRNLHASCPADQRLPLRPLAPFTHPPLSATSCTTAHARCFWQSLPDALPPCCFSRFRRLPAPAPGGSIPVPPSSRHLRPCGPVPLPVLLYKSG